MSNFTCLVVIDCVESYSNHVLNKTYLEQGT